MTAKTTVPKPIKPLLTCVLCGHEGTDVDNDVALTLMFYRPATHCSNVHDCEVRQHYREELQRREAAQANSGNE